MTCMLIGMCAASTLCPVFFGYVAILCLMSTTLAFPSHWLLQVRSWWTSEVVSTGAVVKCIHRLHSQLIEDNAEPSFLPWINPLHARYSLEPTPLWPVCAQLKPLVCFDEDCRAEVHPACATMSMAIGLATVRTRLVASMQIKVGCPLAQRLSQRRPVRNI